MATKRGCDGVSDKMRIYCEMKHIIALLLVAGLAISVAPVFAAEQEPVYVITFKGSINPASANYIIRGINTAEKDGAQAIVVRLDTPGGLMDSMRDIVQKMLAAEVPVVVYVWPNGARAASAGVFISYASHIAAMVPVSNLGSAHPVAISPGGSQEMDETMSEKIQQDAVKYIKSIAEKRGRNAEWAEEAVRKSVNLTSREAKEQNVIEYISEDLEELLAQIDGTTVDLPSRQITLNTLGAPIEHLDMSKRERFLDLLANPNLAYILLLVAIYGIIAELQNPGVVFPGVVGGISLILFLYSFAILPLNTAGLVLIALGIILLIADAMLPSYGLLTLGGIGTFGLGSFMLFDTGSPEFAISMRILAGGIIATSGFFIFLVRTGVKALKKPFVSGPEGLLVGKVVPARTDINPEGKIFAQGAWWTAYTEGQPIKKDEMVRVVAMRGLKVIVEKESEPS